MALKTIILTNRLIAKTVGDIVSSKASKIKMIELFAGVGGFRLAAEGLGVEVDFWNQWEPGSKVQHAASVYRKRFGDEGFREDASQADIALAVKTLKYPTKPADSYILVGGFPCQDYSVAKSKTAALGLEGKKGVLWWPMLELIAKSKPRYVFLENVDRLLKSPSNQRGRDFAVMLRTLGSLGYLVEWRVIDSSDYGALQRRKRVFIIASKLDGRKSKKLTQEDASDLIMSTGVLARAYKVRSTLKSLVAIDLSQAPEELSKSFGLDLKFSPFLNSGVYKNGTAYTVKVEAQESQKRALREALVPDSEVAPEFYVDDAAVLEKWQHLKAGGPRNRTSKDGYKYTYSEGRMNLTDYLDKPSRTIVTGEGGSTPSRFKHLIEINGRYRRLTPVELEKLNGFPENHTQFGFDGTEISNIKRAFFMGNALVVPVVRMAIKVIVSDLEDTNGNKARS